MVDKLCYSVYVSFRGACSNIKILAIIILAYYFGLLMPFFCLANIEVFLNTIKTIDIIDSERTYLVSMSQIPGGENDDIEEALPMLGLMNCLVVIRFWSDVQMGDRSEKLYVVGTGENLGAVERFDVAEGEFSLKEAADTPEDMAECVVAYTLAKRYSLHIGDQVTVNGIAHRISGIVNSFNYYRTIFVPKSSASVGETLQYELYLNYGALPAAGEVRRQVRQLYPGSSISSVQLASDVTRKTLGEGVGKSAAILLVGLLSVLVAVLNTFLVISGKYEENKRVVAVKLALGASKAELGMEIFCENVLSVCAANLMLCVTRPVLTRVASSRSDFIYSWRVHLGLLGLSFIIAAIMSVLLRNKVMKSSPAALLKG